MRKIRVPSDEYAVLVGAEGRLLYTYELGNPVYALIEQGWMRRSYEGVSGFLGFATIRRTAVGQRFVNEIESRP